MHLDQKGLGGLPGFPFNHRSNPGGLLVLALQLEQFSPLSQKNGFIRKLNNRRREQTVDFIELSGLQINIYRPLKYILFVGKLQQQLFYMTEGRFGISQSIQNPHRSEPGRITGIILPKDRLIQLLCLGVLLFLLEVVPLQKPGQQRVWVYLHHIGGNISGLLPLGLGITGQHCQGGG